ncbi:hypothetical protein ACHAXR_011850 [Thalassiosira sp. AJA248-18]
MSSKSAAANATTSPLRAIRKKAAGARGSMPSTAPRKRTYSAPARIDNYSPLSHHYRVDPDDKKLLPGLPVNDDDWARDVHDFFNLISLVPVVVLNVINWNWDILLDAHSKKTMQQAWTGEWFPLFYAITIGYFVADLIWVLLVPNCVKSPGVIIQHHVATIIYLIIPYRNPEDGWLMGACLCVEVNTWLLIARRVFNKQGFGPWVINFSFFSLRIKLISIFFYVTWVAIRCAFYPLILRVLWTIWFTQWKQTGNIFNTRYALALFLHFIFCLLNFKWTYDLFMSKWRASRSGKAAKVEKGL